jgi:hypothetical protein
MSKFFRALMGGVSFVILYIIAVMGAPIVLFILGYSEVDSKPTILNLPIYIVEINGETFFSEATGLGLLLSLLVGISVYYIVTYLVPKKG